MIVLGLDILVAVLLLATIVTCFKLNGRIRILQDSKSELRQCIDQFNISANRAESAIREIHEATRKASDTLQLKIDKASYLADDMSFMIEKGEKLADNLEVGISGARAKVQQTPAAPAAEPGRLPMGVRTAGNTPAAEKVAAQVKQAPASKPVNSIESVLERLSGRANQTAEAKPAPGAAQTAPVLTARPRSQTERELLEALRMTR
ncbi:MAG: hypothetical protein J0L97_01915 [Alphaproteobacteria bacterium]|nr:hypothetical protein [Alphaproteobacteria bacterium]